MRRYVRTREREKGERKEDEPSVGRDDVSSLDGLLRAVRVDNFTLSSLGLDTSVRTLKNLRVKVVALGRRDLKVDAHARVGHHHFVEDVVRVSDPGDRETLKGGEVGGEGGADLEEGLEVGKDLGRVVEVGEGVDNGDRRVLGEGLWESTYQHESRRRGVRWKGAHLDLRMVSDAGHDTVDHGGNDAGSVVQALVNAELDVSRTEEHRVTACAQYDQHPTLLLVKRGGRGEKREN